MRAEDHISTQPLREYLDDTQAPEGYVYHLLGEPVLQTDYLEDVYTLSWQGFVSVHDLVAHHRTILEAYQAQGHLEDLTGTTTFRLAELDSQRKDIDPPQLASIDTLGEEIDSYVQQKFTSPITSVILNYQGERGEEVSVYGNTPELPEEDAAEVSITSNLPLVGPVETLVRSTTQAKLPYGPALFDTVNRDIATYYDFPQTDWQEAWEKEQQRRYEVDQKMIRTKAYQNGWGELHDSLKLLEGLARNFDTVHHYQQAVKEVFRQLYSPDEPYRIHQGVRNIVTACIESVRSANK